MTHRTQAALAFLALSFASLDARADDIPPDMSFPKVGGHVGAVLPFVTLPSKGATQSIGQDFVTIAIASGVTVKLSKRVAVDFENVVGEPLKPGSATTAITIDPGVIYDAGPVALGARLKYDVGALANLGIIPLVHKGFSLGAVDWFIEADFPVTVASTGTSTVTSLTIALHSGFGF
jgi:hypothetical protein